MMATMGPMMTGGMRRLIQLTPEAFTMRAKTTYTRPAKAAPRIRPRNPRLMETPPAKAANMEPRNAKELPRNTGLRNLVKSW